MTLPVLPSGHAHSNKDSTELFLAAEEPEEYKAPAFQVKASETIRLTEKEAPIVYESRLPPEEERSRLSGKKVLLIMPVDFRTDTILPLGLKHYIPPLGILYIASCIRERGAQVKILDMQVELEGKTPSDETVKEILVREKPDLVGIGATIINWDAAVHTMELTRELFPHAKIFVGGPHITALGTKALEKVPLIDFVINGEGEEVAPNLLREYVHDAPDYSRVRGLIFKTNPNEYTITGYNMFLRDLNQIPFPAWDLVKLDHYSLSPLMQFQPGRSVNMISSRGCVFSCIFCDHGVRGSGWRARSPENVVAEFKYLKSLGIRNVWLVDDLFTVNRKRVQDICKLMVEEKLDMSWSCQARVDCVDEPTLRSMKEAGCKLISYGVESGNERVLKIIKKKLDMNKARETITLTKKIGIQTRCFFMMGFPTETKDEIEDTLKFALELDPTFITYSISTPLPNTELWDMLQGKMDYETWSQFNSFGSDKLVYVPDGITQEELTALWKKAHRQFLLRPSWLLGRFIDGIQNPYNFIRYYRASSAMKLVA
jgi:radical SAM superfamily enzyme YgiQ (UPF0313 family)